MPFRSDMRFEKGEKKVQQKVDSNSGRSRKKSTRLTIYATETDVKQVSFFSVDYPNHTLVGGVSVNSLCQQGGLFALRVNRHSVYFNLINILSMTSDYLHVKIK